MESSSKLSVVIPVYNVEEYLDKCLKSVVNQTFKNLEIIIVNDGSTDNCSQIIKKYESQDSRITVIEKKNGGVVSARKTGMSVATGDYLHYLDGDDYIELNCYELAMGKAIAENADMVFFKMFKSGEMNPPCDGPKGIISGIDFLKFSYEHNVYFSIWGHIHKRELYNNPIQYYEEISMGEDLIANQQLAYYSTRITFLNIELYHYVYRPSSITNTRMTEKKANDLIRHTEILLNFCKGKKECDCLERSLFIHYMNNLNLLYSLRYFKNTQPIAKRARAMMKKYPGLEKESYLGQKYKLVYLYAMSPFLGRPFAQYYIAKGKIK